MVDEDARSRPGRGPAADPGSDLPTERRGDHLGQPCWTGDEREAVSSQLREKLDRGRARLQHRE